MDIESYYRKPVSGFCDNFANKQIANLLPGMIKKKENKQYENMVPEICLPVQFNNDKYHYGSELYCLLKMKNSDCHSRNGRDFILIQALSPDKIENTVCQNNIYQYDLYKNTGNTQSDKISANVISAEKPEIIPVKSTPAESIQAESTQTESYQTEKLRRNIGRAAIVLTPVSIRRRLLPPCCRNFLFSGFLTFPRKESIFRCGNMCRKKYLRSPAIPENPRFPRKAVSLIIIVLIISDRSISRWNR